MPDNTFGRNIYEAFREALGMHTPEPQVPTDLERDFELSLQAEAIAIGLMRCAWIQAGKPAIAVDKVWIACSPNLRERYRGLAERAIQTLDPKVRLDAKDKAAQETAAFIESAGDLTFNAATWALIAHEAVSRYESILASLRLSGGDQ